MYFWKYLVPENTVFGGQKAKKGKKMSGFKIIQIMWGRSLTVGTGTNGEWSLTYLFVREFQSQVFKSVIII